MQPPGGGGGGHSPLNWVGGAAGGSRPDPVSNRSAHKKYTLSQYTLLKLSLCIYPVAILHTSDIPCPIVVVQ